MKSSSTRSVICPERLMDNTELFLMLADFSLEIAIPIILSKPKITSIKPVSKIPTIVASTFLKKSFIKVMF